jgi:hypothetical protein
MSAKWASSGHGVGHMIQLSLVTTGVEIVMIDVTPSLTNWQPNNSHSYPVRSSKTSLIYLVYGMPQIFLCSSDMGR